MINDEVAVHRLTEIGLNPMASSIHREITVNKTPSTGFCMPFEK